MLKKFLTRQSNDLPAPLRSGDHIASSMNVANTLTTAGAGTLLVNHVCSNLLIRSGPVGAVADTTPTAAAIINSLNQVLSGGASAGDAWVLRYQNTTAQILTLTAVDVSVVVTNPTINASSVKDFLCTLQNSTPQAVVAGVGTTNGNKILTGFTDAQLATISPGMLVTGTGIGASAKVVGVGNAQVTVDVNSSATVVAGAGSGVTVTFNPWVSMYGIGQGLL